MKKYFYALTVLFSVAFCLITEHVTGQVANYSFSQSNESYTSITGGTVSSSASTTTIDDIISTVTLPVAFPYNGASITTVGFSPNGYLIMGSTTSHGFDNPISSTAASNGVISALGMDLVSTATTSEQRWQQIGNEIVFQWKQFKRYNLPALPSEMISFQIRLNTLSGEIKMVYDGSTNIDASTNKIPQVGLRGSTNSDFIARRLTDTVPNNTPTWNNTIAATSNADNVRFTSTGPAAFPVAGLTITWNRYCIPTYTNGAGLGDFISLVNIPGTALNSTSGAAASPYYTIFPTTGSTTATLTAGATYNLNVKGGTWPNGYITAWIDYNNDGIFASAEVLGQSANVGNSTQQTIQFTVPINSVLTNVRFRLRESDTVPGPNSAEACGPTNSSFGETEDYTIGIAAPPACVGTASTTLTSSASETGCGISPTNITLSASGGSEGTGGISTLFYQGNTCPVIAYANEFLIAPSTDATTVGALSNGNRTFTSNSADPMIHLETALTNTIDPAKTKYVIIRYRVATNPGLNNSFEIYFQKNGIILSEARVVRQSINTDGNWHIATIDMSANTEWNNTGGNITGFRFDYCNLSATVMELDYVLLADTPILDNTNANDTSINLSPLASATSTQYRTFRIFECSSQIAACNVAVTKSIINNDRTFNQTGNWSVNTNWLQGVVPTSNNCVIIPNGKNVVIDIPGAVAKTVKVDAGGRLTISKDQALKVTDTFINSNTANLIPATNPQQYYVTIESDGNLLQTSNVTNTGDVAVKRNLTFSSGRNQYNYLISPVKDQILKNIYKDAAGNAVPVPFTLYQVETNNTFLNSSGAYIQGRGLAVKEATLASYSNPAMSAVFAGVPVNGTFTYPLLNSNTTDNLHGYNLIGNPYPSKIDLLTFYSNNSASGNLTPTFYFWDTLANGRTTQVGNTYGGQAYATFNAATPPGEGTGTKALGDAGTNSTKKPTRYVKVGQAFMARTKVNNLSVSFDNTIRAASTDSEGFFGKGTKESAPFDRYWLNLTSPASITSEMAVVYFKGGDDAYTKDDSFALIGSDAVYSLVDNEKISINGKNIFADTDKVFLGTQHFSTGNYVISLGEKNGVFADGQKIYLKDKQTGTLTNLSDGNYTFTANAGENMGRFEIVYKPETVLSTNDLDTKTVEIYRDGADFVVRSAQEKLNSVEVYDATGRLLLNLQGNKSEWRFAASQLISGIYFVKARSVKGEEFTRKVRN